MRFPPRPYQTHAIEEIRAAWRAGKRKIVLVAPTGSGKTVVAAEIIEGATGKGNRIVFLAHRKELIDQCSKTLDEIGVDHGVIKSGHWRHRPDLPVQVASVQTLVSKRKCKACKETPDDPCSVCDDKRWIRRPMPDAQIVVVDETHRCLAPSYQEILDEYQEALVLGLTATPWRLDGRGLGVLYQTLVATVQVAELVDQGYLLPIRAYAPDLPDLSDVKTRRGDYDSDSVSRIMGSDKLVGNIVDHWHRLGEGMRTVIFAASVENSQSLTQRFVDAGVAAEHLDGTTKDPERDAILARLASGETTIVCNVDVLVEGYDLPSLGCIVLARPTLSLTRYLQQVGRGMRPHEDQGYMVLIDHAGCVHEHGLPTDPRRWSLEDRRKKKGDSTEIDGSPCVACEACGALRPLGVELCPSCAGVQVAVFRGLVIETDGELVEVRSTYQCKSCESTNVRLEPWGDLEVKIRCRDCHETTYDVDRQAAKQASDDRRRQEYERLRGVQRAKGMKSGWVGHRYKELFGTWPPRAWSAPMESQGARP